MVDLKLKYDVAHQDWDLFLDETGTDLATDEGLQSAVILSLFCDRRAREDDPLPGGAGTSRRGWWGDLVDNVYGDREGSRLWLLEREKNVDAAVVGAKEKIQEALNWLLQDKVAAGVEVAAWAYEGRSDVLAVQIKIKRTDGNVVVLDYDYAWQDIRSA